MEEKNICYPEYGEKHGKNPFFNLFRLKKGCFDKTGVTDTFRNRHYSYVFDCFFFNFF